MLVTGAAGRLGATIVEVFRDAEVIAHTRSSLDITDAAAVSHAVSDARPDVIINCAAFNDVDGAESAPLAALAVNAFAPRNLARAAREVGATFVHYSTDFVFDGKAVAALRRGRTAVAAERLRRVEAARRMVCARRPARLRPARREPVRRR